MMLNYFDKHSLNAGRELAMYVSVRDVIVTHAGYNTVIEGLRELDVWAVELVIDRDMTVTSLTDANQRLPLRTDADVDAYRRHLEENNVRVSALLLANNFNAPNLDEELNWVIESIRRAHKLGCDAVRIDSAMRGEVELPFEERVERVVQCLKRVITATEDTEMPLGIENHGRQGNDPAFLDAVMEGVGSPRLGLTLDTGNFYWYGHPLSQVYEI
ncbi:MAG TPA: sugar phosphate isomerase/epimerase, partial [Armatimonadetes bacterium]|nr:sugar phosphate isomerase/epimerase [Armatimonadota bacterium]